MNKIFTQNDHYLWTNLYAKTMRFLPEFAHTSVLEGIKTLGFPANRVPDFDEINKILDNYTDWQVIPMEKMVEDDVFISMLSDKKYPCRTWLRSELEINNDEDTYDMFHDVIGHLPLLTINDYSDYLQGLGQLAKDNIDDKKFILALKRLYWHSIQFGLIESGKSIKIYGAHLLSSGGEVNFALSAGVSKYNFNIETMIKTPYIKGNYQEKYFVIKDYKELVNGLANLESTIRQHLV